MLTETKKTFWNNFVKNSLPEVGDSKLFFSKIFKSDTVYLKEHGCEIIKHYDRIFQITRIA